jgi:type II secretory pathway component PulJ
MTLSSMTRSGMTLLEVVIALSLSALMLISLTGVLSGLSRQRTRVNAVRHSEWAYELDRALWNDLAQARGVSLHQGALTMSIPASQPRTNEIVQSSANQTVVYRIERTGPQGNRLTRTIYSGLNASGLPLISQTLLWNIRNATFERVDDQGTSQPLPKELGPTPRAFRYQLWFDNDLTTRSNQILVR